jgi:cellulose synthase/poly-beta-1,6-N-acetylglucosamine synthase-like glycosyltransferase
MIIRARAFSQNKSRISEFRNTLHEKNLSDTNFTVILPSYKNSKEIKKSVEHLLDMGISAKQILVVDDFSNDEHATAKEASKLGVRVISITRNSKKVGALNLGMQAVNTDYVILLDSDSFIVSSYHRLKEAIGEMQKLGLDGMAGRVLPCGVSPEEDSRLLTSKKSGLLLQFQFLEYDQAMRLGRGAMYALKKENSMFKTKYAEVSLISGAFGIFRRTAMLDALERFEDKEESFLGEDMERTWKLLSNDGKVGYSDDLVVLTSAPLGAVRHFKQRVFWSEGLFRCVFTDFGWSLTKKKISGVAYAMSLVRDVLLQPLRILSIFFIFTNPIGFLSILVFYFILNIFITQKISGDLNSSKRTVVLLPFYRLYISNIPTTIGYLHGFFHLAKLYLNPNVVKPTIGIAKEWNGVQ